MDGRAVTRRELIVVGTAAAAAAAALERAAPAAARAEWSQTTDFAALGSGDGWPGWTCSGVANLRRADGSGVLEAGSDVFPCDPRPVAFALDRRFVDGGISARVNAGGAGAGLVLRRVGPRDYYAAVVDDEQGALVVIRRSGDDVAELARTVAPPMRAPFQLAFTANGTNPTSLVATFTPAVGVPVVAEASDGSPALQRAGDPGVLATARTLWPSAGPSEFPALGNLHLLPYGVQEGQAFMQTAVGEAVLDTIRERSTASFAQIAISATGPPATTAPSVVAAGSGAPLRGGAKLRVAGDVPARVEIEFARNRAFRRSRRIRAGRTNAFGSSLPKLAGLEPGRRVYWRPWLTRAGITTVGPVRSFRVLPGATDGARATVAIAACASQFGPIFDQLASRRPDVFVWQGDLNYPDTLGPLAQTVPAYAGIWRDFLANPRIAPIADGALFAAQRDDHDYGVQDANSTNLVPPGIAPWDNLIDNRLYYRFVAGPAELWVLDQRHFKTDPTTPDTPAKTLLGTEQREWLMRTLASSRAPFKVICSPCTLAPLPANGRDGSWATGFKAERDLLLKHVREHVSGRTLFVTGDTHWTMAYERDGLFEARPCPLGIPTPNDITITDPQVAEDARKAPGVLYADDDMGHFALLELSVKKRVARLDLSFVRQDGEVPFRRTFTARARRAHGSVA